MDLPAHDLNGPSVLYRRALCPGSAQQEANRADVPNEHSDRGNALHEIARRVLAEGASVLADVPAEDADAVQFVVDCANSLKERAGQSAMVIAEHRVDLWKLGIQAGGTIDVALVNPGGPAFAQDHKFGRSWVDHPRWNLQCQAYAWGLREDFGCTEVTFGIAQPAAEERHRWREATFTSDELDAFGDRIHAIVLATQQPDPPLVPGEHCGFCRAKASCPARARVVAEISVLRDPMAVVRAMTPKDRAAFYERLDLALEQLKGARDAIEAEALAGTLALEGYQVGTGRRSRSWADEGVAQAALLRLAAALGKDASQLIRTEIASPAEAEKALGKAAKESLGELTTWRDGKPKLVRATA